MIIVYSALLIGCAAELFFGWLPRWRPLQFAVGPLMLVALFGLISPDALSQLVSPRSRAAASR